MVDSIEKIAAGLNGLAAVIRKHGTCAPAALEECAQRLRTLAPEASGADYVMVPREPTPEMLDEACKWVDGEFPEYAREVYRVMIAAAPTSCEPTGHQPPPDDIGPYPAAPSTSWTVERRVPRQFGGKTKALAMCPASCGCLWVNNGDGSMSLFGENSKSCDECERLPWATLLPISITPADESGAGEDAARCKHERSHGAPWRCAKCGYRFDDAARRARGESNG